MGEREMDSVPRVRYLGQGKNGKLLLRCDDHESGKALPRLPKRYLVGIGDHQAINGDGQSAVLPQQTLVMFPVEQQRQFREQGRFIITLPVTVEKGAPYATCSGGFSGATGTSWASFSSQRGGKSETPPTTVMAESRTLNAVMVLIDVKIRKSITSHYRNRPANSRSPRRNRRHAQPPHPIVLRHPHHNHPNKPTANTEVGPKNTKRNELLLDERNPNAAPGYEYR